MNCQQICKISRKKNLTKVKIFLKVLGGGATFWNTLYIYNVRTHITTVERRVSDYFYCRKDCYAERDLLALAKFLVNIH